MESQTENPRPGIASPGWEEWVLSHFEPGELVNGNPKARALWRVAELVLGLVTHYECRVIKAPADASDRTCTVVASVQIWPHEGGPLPPGRECCYEGAADGSEFNINRGFDKYPVATTETRAKGRAMCTALRLRKAISAEEPVADPAAAEPEELTAGQVKSLDVMARRADVNVAKFVMDECRRHGVNFPSYGSISRLPREFGVALCKAITQYQASGNTPPSLKGYDANWRGGK